MADNEETTIGHFGAIHSMWKRFQDGLLQTAAAAAANAEPRRLTDDEAFAVAALAGVPYEAKYRDGEMVFETKPCGVVHTGTELVVYTREDRPQEGKE